MSNHNESIDVTVSVPVELLRATARDAVSRLFAVPSSNWSDRGGAGWQHISSEVTKAIKTIDYGPIITDALDDVLRPTVAEAVTEAVRAEVKKQIKMLKAENGQ